MVRLLLGVVLLTTIGTVQHHTAALQLDATVGQEGFPLAGGRPPSLGRAKYRGFEQAQFLCDSIEV